jgi:uncharacterized YigZ family protein
MHHLFLSFAKVRKKSLEKKGTYLTITEVSEGFYKEKGSKFLAFAVPCKTEDEAKIRLAGWRKEHYQAVHVCYAFRFGSDKKQFRSSDDGEPSNSAGPPILGQIQSFDVTNVLVAVVRYYGGTNLGVGGLINAYRTAAKEALQNAEIVEQIDAFVVELLFEYDQMPAVMAAVKAIPMTVLEQDFGLSCRIVGEFPVSNESALQKLTDLKDIELIQHGIRT